MQTQNDVFTKEVHNKYLVFNTLFSRLPYDKMTNIGQLLPFLHDKARQGFENAETPTKIIDCFFEKYTSLKTEKEKIDLLFRFITYIERQVVLFDSVEDAAFEKLNNKNAAGTLDAILTMAKQENAIESVRQKLQDFRVRVVFTAHPTQFYPNSVLRIIQDLEMQIQKNDISAIDSLLQQLGKTPFINDIKPSPIEEAQSIIFYLRHVYYESLSRLHEKVYSNFLNGDVDFNPVFELGFWPGGDRDGNPFVTAEITKKVAQELRTNIIKCYYNSFKGIRRRFTFKGIIPMLTRINHQLYNNMFGLENSLTAESLLADINAVRDQLMSEHNGIFVEELDVFIRRVKLFGMHFASMDIRQDSSIHLKVMQAVVDQFGITDAKYVDWSHECKMEFLSNYQGTIDITKLEEGIIKDTFETVKVVQDIQAQNGEKACHRYIISNSTSATAVMEVVAIFRFAGIAIEDLKIDIVPLFETIEGLSEAQNTMDELYSHPVYAPHLKKRKQVQHIMLGFSDGTKDGGYVKANWGIFQTKEELSTVSAKHQIGVVFFDGRGGPPARGGGKSHQFYASQGPTIANNEIQITIQGQTISSMYGSIPQATFNFEQLLSAGVINDCFADKSAALNAEDRLLIHELATLGGDKYAELKAHPQFVSYLEHKSTLKYYGQTKIGSRPSKRNSDSKLKLSDLRAIPFVGSWSQLKQNIPGYYGFGWALQQKIDQGQLEQLQNLYQNSLYFKTLMENSMMALSKTFFPLTNYMKNDPVYGSFWDTLYEEYQRSVKSMLLVSKQSQLMESEPTNMRSVKYRESLVLPLLAIQQFALQKVETIEDEELKAVYEKMITRSLFGNINASRNSA